MIFGFQNGLALGSANAIQTKKLVEELGGKTISGKEKEGDNGWYMFFLDVEGNRFGIYELQEGMKS